MIVITKNTETVIYYTASEKKTLTAPYYLFVFTHRETEETIIFVCTNISTTLRFDKSNITVNDHFADSNTGLWKYEVYEQESPTNTDISLTGNLVESGYMKLTAETVAQPTYYEEQDNIFKTYNVE